jgi:SpoIID/LytB domain protein
MTPRRTTSLITASAILGGAALLAAGAATDPAAAAALHIPRHATIVIHGHGYGHGHGMSQYGAEGAARAGKSAGQIVRFYYPRTKSGTFRGQVRVLISADTDHDTTVAARSGLEVHDLGDGSKVTLPTTGEAAGATRWRLSSPVGDPAQVSYLTDAWHVWRTLAGDGEFRASKSIRLIVAGGAVTYRGSLQSRTSTAGGTPHRITVNKVSMEDYVRAVVPREAFPSWHQAALRAQAIAARSYAAFAVEDSTNHLYQLCDTSLCQVYGGKSAETPSTNRATAKSAGRIRTFHSKPAFTQFSSSNGGWLAAGSQPYLVAKKDPYDGWSGNPNHTWRTKVSDAAIENAWSGIGNLRTISVLDRDGNGEWNGRIEHLELVGGAGSVTLTGDEFRAGLGLRSTWLKLTVK